MTFLTRAAKKSMFCTIFKFVISGTSWRLRSFSLIFNQCLLWWSCVIVHIDWCHPIKEHFLNRGKVLLFLLVYWCQSANRLLFNQRIVSFDALSGLVCLHYFVAFGRIAFTLQDWLNGIITFSVVYHNLRSLFLFFMSYQVWFFLLRAFNFLLWSRVWFLIIQWIVFLRWLFAVFIG